jgi:HAE1 family hydrophobic/amphiphilic exporter-1
MTIVGYGFGGIGQNQCMAFIRLKDWKLRNKPELKTMRLRVGR